MLLVLGSSWLGLLRILIVHSVACICLASGPFWFCLFLVCKNGSSVAFLQSEGIRDDVLRQSLAVRALSMDKWNKLHELCVSIPFCLFCRAVPFCSISITRQEIEFASQLLHCCVQQVCSVLGIWEYTTICQNGAFTYSQLSALVVLEH